VLTVEGRKSEKSERHYLYQGISARAFRRQFNLADYVKVNGADFDNGLLRISLVREIPEAMKPRRVEIRPTLRSRWSIARPPNGVFTVAEGLTTGPSADSNET
jgi:hypothetical protein